MQIICFLMTQLNYIQIKTKVQVSCATKQSVFASKKEEFPLFLYQIFQDSS